MAELNLNTTPPTEQTQETEENKVERQPVVETPPTEQPKVEQKEAVTHAQAGEPPKAEELKVDEFIENFNKRYGKQYKTDDDIKGLFELSKKITEQEGRLSDYESIKKAADERQRKIEELESLNDPLKFFSSPESYVAEQLKIKYPNRDTALLHEVVTTDVDKIGDFDLLIKAEKLFNRNLPEGGRYVKDVLYKRYGIDAETDLKELDGATLTQIAMDANAVREKIGALKKEVELPQVMTPEQREQAKADALAKREQALAGVRDEFTKFEKFSIEGFEYDVPTEYKQKAADLFNGYFIDAGVEMNEENLKLALQLRDANFLYENFGKIKEVIAKQAQTASQAKVDEELHNETPPNTATRTDQVQDEQPQGIGKLVSDLLGR